MTGRLMDFVLLLCALPIFIFQTLFFLWIPLQRAALFVLMRLMAHFFSQENEVCPTNWKRLTAKL